ncbi:hypothetical protein A3L09_05655 [Thermococcus profundus]|uniref:DUF373 family protein n=1 Tax=Thermococcus profundus TaxID=49899 RepID=A0A2Z2MBB5_THEPR|nr:DUF373 family protein [Thermococcus profundus]ASJ02773.1 hypothetical protein A3L09_05655 [Thermococcus profundus]
MKVLVLAIDRDDDFGKKAGVKGPVVGKGKCIDAALKLSLADPEDSDANVVYAAVRLYDELKKSGEFEDVEVALITGHPDVGVKSDLELGRQLDEVLERFPADGVIPVTDGAEDEQVFPILSSRLPIVSSRRVVVKQNETIETTYYVIYRYIKEILSDPEASKVFLGIPGLIFLLYGVGKLISVSYPQSMSIISNIVVGIILLFIGGYAFTKGFRIQIFKAIMNEFIQVIFGVSGLLIIIAGMINSYANIDVYAQELLNEIPQPGLIKFILYVHSINTTIIIGIAVILIGRIVQAYLRKDHHIWYNIAGLLILPTFWIIVDVTSRYALSVINFHSFKTIMEISAAFADVIFSVMIATFIRKYFIEWASGGELEAGRSDQEVRVAEKAT